MNYSSSYFSIVKFGLLGKKIAYSASPVLFDLLSEDAGKNVSYSIIDRDLTKSKQIKKLVNELVKEGYSGINVTIPYKEMAFSICDYLIDQASMIEAVNTLMFSEGKITGLNTDYYAMKQAVNKLNIYRESNVLIRGSGGAAKAYAFALSKTPFLNLFISNRTLSHARLLQQRLKFNGRHAEVLEEHEIKNFEFAGLVNATPVGRNENETPFDKELIAQSEFVIDAVYKKGQTLLIREALKMDKSCISGIQLLFLQGLSSFEAFTSLKLKNASKLLESFEKRMNN